MGYAVVLYFDQKGENIIRNMWETLADKGISAFMHESNSRPHITLAIYDEAFDDMKAFIDSVENYTKGIKHFKLTLSNIGMFNTREGIVFVAPKVTKELLNIHSKLYEDLDQYTQYAWKYYMPDEWIPHCTIAGDSDKNKLLQAIDAVSDIFKPFEITIEKLGIVKFSPVEYIREFNIYVESTKELAL